MSPGNDNSSTDRAKRRNPRDYNNNNDIISIKYNIRGVYAYLRGCEGNVPCRAAATTLFFLFSELFFLFAASKTLYNIILLYFFFCAENAEFRPKKGDVGSSLCCRRASTSSSARVVVQSRALYIYMYIQLNGGNDHSVHLQ